MKIRNITITATVFIAGITSASAQANSWVDRTTLSGFFSSRYSQTDNEAYFAGNRETGINKDGSFQGTKLGLNIRSQVNDQVIIATQISSFFEEESYATHVDWAFASFDLTPSFTLRAGKIKYPVGLVNEYVDVGVAYPWIQAPLVIYSEESNGPQATREAYTGASLLWNGATGNWEFGTDLFWGQVGLTNMQVKGMMGLTLRGTWNDMVQLQGSYYSGEMKADPSGPLAGMNNKTHQAALAGVKVDWDNVIAYAEYADVNMDAVMPAMADAMDSKSWYTTLGYHIGQWLPHVTYQNWKRGNDYGHDITTLGLNYALSTRTVIKFEASRIKSDITSPSEPMISTMLGRDVVGLFDVTDTTGTALSDDSVNLYSVSIDVTF